MKSREELRNDYEEALFALIMDDIMELEGEELIAERERLEASDEYKVPDDVNERCLELINRCFDEKQGTEKKHRVRKVWRTALIAALISVLCFTTAYATVPAVKTAADELIVAISRVSAKLYYGEEIITTDNGKYVFPGIPEEFYVLEEGEIEHSKWITYSNDVGTIRIDISSNYTYDMEYLVDVENADSIEEIQINDFNGLVIEKENRIYVAIQDEARGNFIFVVSNEVDKDTLLSIVEKIKYIE